MFQESEIITLLIAIGIGGFLCANRKPLLHLYAWKLLALSYLFYLAVSCFTVLEGIFWETGLNHLEHISMLLFSITFFLWCWQIGFRKEKNQ